MPVFGRSPCATPHPSTPGPRLFCGRSGSLFKVRASLSPGGAGKGPFKGPKVSIFYGPRFITAAANEKAIDAATETKHRAIGVGIQVGIDAALKTDPWIPTEIKSAASTGVVTVVNDILRRVKDAKLEVQGRGSSELRAQVLGAAPYQPLSSPRSKLVCG